MRRGKTVAVRRRVLLVFSCALALAPAVLFMRAQDHTAVRRAETRDNYVEVRVNGAVLGSALVTDANPWPAGVYLPFQTLRHAIDGTDSRSRLRVERSAVFAAATGACRSCIVRVNRAVLISSELHFVEGVAYVPLSDVVRALEGRMTTDVRRTVVTIHVGKCAWCILEPNL